MFRVRQVVELEETYSKHPTFEALLSASSRRGFSRAGSWTSFPISSNSNFVLHLFHEVPAVVDINGTKENLTKEFEAYQSFP